MRIVIVDDSGARASVLEEGLREAGYDDIHFVPPRGAFVARIVCACFDIGLHSITAAIREQGLADVAAIGAALRAGTNCGSCRPALAGILCNMPKEAAHG